MLDVFNDDAFNVVSLTARANKIPFVPRQISAAGLFEEDGVTTTTVVVEERDGKLGMVSPTPRGGPGDTVARDKRTVRSFAVPHFQRDDAIMADEVQNVRVFGTENLVETIEGLVDRKIQKHTRALDATLEHQRVGAIKGVVTDKDGNTVWNLFNEFGVSQPSAVSFALNSDSTNVREKCFEVIESMEDALDGDMMAGVHAFVGRDFWKALIEHQSVKETYLNTVQAQELRGNPNSYRFEFGGIVWERYRTGSQATADNSGGAFIGVDEARFVPLGVPELFITRFAPADYESTVNTVGIPRYARQYPMPNGKGRHLEVQMNAISICTRPAVLYRGTRT